MDRRRPGRFATCKPSAAVHDTKTLTILAQASGTYRLLTKQRKCWWDGIDLVVPIRPTTATPAVVPPHIYGTLSPLERSWLEQGMGQLVRVWIRRVWTLEMSLI